MEAYQSCGYICTTKHSPLSQASEPLTKPLAMLLGIPLNEEEITSEGDRTMNERRQTLGYFALEHAREVRR